MDVIPVARETVVNITDDGVFVADADHRIVDAHGWVITVTESDRGGARFEVRRADQVSWPTDASTATDWPGLG
jgi:hypothetical protein